MEHLPEVLRHEPIERELVKQIAMDIGKETASYIEIHYPEMFKAASSTAKLSIRNHIYNEIMATLNVIDTDKIKERLEDRKVFRRKLKAQWKKIREKTTPNTAKE